MSGRTMRILRKKAFGEGVAYRVKKVYDQTQTKVVKGVKYRLVNRTLRGRAAHYSKLKKAFAAKRMIV